MKNLVLVFVLLLAITACTKQSEETNKASKITASAENQSTDNSIVNIYYFHGKQRCKTCVAVEKLTKEVIEKNFAGNDKIHFTVLNIEDAANDALVEKYKVAWNALIIANSNNFKDITEEAFALAVENPDKLTSEILSTINSMSK